MISGSTWLLLAFILVIAIRTMSYGVWTWKQKNPLGAVVVFLIAAAALVLPAYMLLLRKG